MSKQRFYPDDACLNCKYFRFYNDSLTLDPENAEPFCRITGLTIPVPEEDTCASFVAKGISVGYFESKL